jgi:protein-tyrosine phosphatase
MFIPIIMFASVSVQAQQRPVIKRDVTLEGVVNFRDMGGYVTTNGQKIAMGRLYRSANLSRLTNNDLKELQRRKVYTVIDFRSKSEAELAPDRLLPGADYLQLSFNNVDSTVFSNSSGFDAMITFYSDISHFREQFSPFFRKLITQPDTSALVFHCAIGKDRTGIAAALLLYALDVPMETILSDYTSTNFFRKGNNEEIINELEKQGMEHTTAIQLLEAHPAYLEATFNVIIRKYGSMDSFLNIELGVNEMARMMLREKYLLS